MLLASHLRHRSPWSRLLRWGLILLVLAAMVQEGVGQYYDRRMTEAAQAMSGRDDLTIRCNRVWDTMLDLRPNPGYVYWGSSEANLQLPECFKASRWADDPYDDDKRYAIMVLTHEVAHLVGHFDEAETECVAMWALPQTAIALGGTREEGLLAARWYAVNHNALLRADYAAPGCLAGSPPPSPLYR